MLKIFNSQQMLNWDNFTIEKEPIASIDMMERACTAFVQWFRKKISVTKTIGIVCGTGNNGGDGLGIARLLNKYGYYVIVWGIKKDINRSENFNINKKKLPQKVKYQEIATQGDIPTFDTCYILIDAIFGSGLSRPIGGIYEQVIRRINKISVIRVAVDMPSGLFAHTHSNGTIVKAHYTISFQAPKLAFLLPENKQYVGTWIIVDIGLSKKYRDKTEVSHFITTQQSVENRLEERPQFSHKGDFGKALLIAGCYGKMGACTLAARAAIRSGLGTLTVHVPQRGYEIIQTTVPEAMVSVDQDKTCFASCPKIEHYDTLAIGPGLGQSEKTIRALGKVLEHAHKPLILDADGLNIIASNRELLHMIPKGSILTPHLGELTRITGKWKHDFDCIEKAQALAQQIESIIVIKGAHTAICAPDGKVYFNNTGNPGMATGGSGDVLTGVLTGLLSQQIDPLDASILGVYIHGLAGDIAAKKQGQNALIASDIIDFLPQAFRCFSHE